MIDFDVNVGDRINNCSYSLFCLDVFATFWILVFKKMLTFL